MLLTAVDDERFISDCIEIPSVAIALLALNLQLLECRNDAGWLLDVVVSFLAIEVRAIVGRVMRSESNRSQVKRMVSTIVPIITECCQVYY